MSSTCSEEEFIQVVGDVGWEHLYSVNRKGDVFSTRSNRFMKWCLKVRSKKYPDRKDAQISVLYEGKQYRPLVARMVAQAFIPNPKDKPQVNHIDGNPLNNHVSNLEWVTDLENKRHAQDNWLTNRAYNKEQFEMVRELSLAGKSRLEVSIATGLKVSCVRDIRLDKYKSHPEFAHEWLEFKKASGRKHICPPRPVRRIE